MLGTPTGKQNVNIGYTQRSGASRLHVNMSLNVVCTYRGITNLVRLQAGAILGTGDKCSGFKMS